MFDTTQRLFGKHGKDIICQMSFSESMQKEKEKKPHMMKEMKKNSPPPQTNIQTKTTSIQPGTLSPMIVRKCFMGTCYTLPCTSIGT